MTTKGLILRIVLSRVDLVWCPREHKNSNSLFRPWTLLKATKGLTALASQMDCDQTAMALLSVTSAVFLIAKLHLALVSLL
jgi:hypothetical protein